MSDDTPTPDQAPGALHPRETRRLFGHDAAEQAFLTAFASDRLHHALCAAWRMGHQFRLRLALAAGLTSHHFHSSQRKSLPWQGSYLLSS